MSEASRVGWLTARFESDPAALVVRFDRPARAASSAVLGGGLRDVHAVVHHSVRPGDERALAEPVVWLRGVCRQLALDPETAVALVTGVDLARTVRVEEAAAGISVVAFATAGLTNALRVGDPATFASVAPGTINVIVVIDAPLSDAALVEAVSMTVEARTLAVLEAGVSSTRSRLPATGTGTDAIVVVAPRDGATLAYCGKHTVLGERLGRSVLRAVATAVAGAMGNGAA